MMGINDDTTITAVEEQISTEIGTEIVILQLDTGTYYGIDGVGTEIWELLQDPRTVRELQHQINSSYDVSPDRVRQDVESLLQELNEAKLIKRVDE